MLKYLFWVFFFGIGCKAFGQIEFRKFYKGYYINNTGEKIEGFIKYIRGNNGRIEFKKNEEDKKKKVQTIECSEFVLDSSIRFIKAGGFYAKMGISNEYIERDFLEVLEEGKVSLYKHYGTVGSYAIGNTYAEIENLVIKKEDFYVGLHPNIKKRKKELKERYADSPDIIDILVYKDENEMRKLIKEYNIKNQ